MTTSKGTCILAYHTFSVIGDIYSTNVILLATNPLKV